MPQIFVLPRPRALDDDANPLAGALLYFFQTETTTPQAVYSDLALTTPHAHPVVANAAGEFPKIYLSPAVVANYRVRLSTSSGVMIYQEDDVDRFTTSQAEIAAAIYSRTTEEIAEGVTPVNYSYETGHLLRYGTNTTPGTTNMTIAFLNALNSNTLGEIYIPPGTYLISASLPLYKQNVRGSAKEDVILVCNGDFPCFTNSGIEFITGSVRRLTIRYNSGVQPTVASGNNQKIGILFEVVSARSPNFYEIEDVEVQGAWWAYYDDSGSYACNLSRVFARECQNGFYKANGTTFTFNQCIGLNVNKGFLLTNNDNFTLTACANDGAVITTGGSANEFSGCVSFSILGFDSESNTVGGDSSTLFSFLDCAGTFAGASGHVNAFSENIGFTSLIKCDDSNMLISGHRARRSAGVTELTMTGDGTYYHVLAVNDSQVTVIGSEFYNPTTVSGTPIYRPFHGTGTSHIQVLGCKYDGTFGSNSYELKTLIGEQTQTLTGCTTSPTGTARYRLTDGVVVLQLPAISGTSDTAAATLTPALPAAFRPARAQRLPVFVTDNTVTAVGVLEIGTDGSMTLSPSPNSGTFTSSGTKGIAVCSGSYCLD